MSALSRPILLAFTGFLAIGLCSARADEGAEAVKEKLARAKQDYDASAQKFKKTVIDLLDKREDEARKSGSIKVVEQVKAERAAFEKSGEVPGMIPAATQDPIIAARTKLDTAYKNAVKEFLVLKLDDAVASIEKERNEFFLAAAIQFGKRTHLANLKPFDIRVPSNIPFEKDSSRFKMNGEVIPHSLFTHPDSNGEASVSYTLAGKMVAFRVNIGIPRHLDPQENPVSPVTFEVLGDKKSLWKSEPVTNLDSFQNCTVNVEKVKVLTLRVHCQKNGWATAVWFAPIVAE
jgi:hypothetical protein